MDSVVGFAPSVSELGMVLVRSIAQRPTVGIPSGFSVSRLLHALRAMNVGGIDEACYRFLRLRKYPISLRGLR
jgi:hypothetical protein